MSPVIATVILVAMAVFISFYVSNLMMGVTSRARASILWRNTARDTRSLYQPCERRHTHEYPQMQDYLQA